MAKEVRFLDLFAGIGGIRLGFERVLKNNGYEPNCVMTSEIKSCALRVLNDNFPHDNIVGDITKIEAKDIPDFDFLLAGFPCQPFSAGGKRMGFVDTRGTLFFEIERILREKSPEGFLLENVEGLVKHDLQSKNDSIGRTLSIILQKLEVELDYKVTWNVLDSVDFGLPQSRKRVFIVGTKKHYIDIKNFPSNRKPLRSILEKGLNGNKSEFISILLKHYDINDLIGKSIKDKRGGGNNIHSWDLELKGSVSKQQRELLNMLLKERRKKRWAREIGIDWMDGMPLTLEQISTFFTDQNLEEMLNDLTTKGYLRYEHPKKLIIEETDNGLKKYRQPDPTLPKGYNIVTGKLSFEINKILNPDDIAPTLVATDFSRIVVPDGKGLRKLTRVEAKRLFGFPDDFQLNVSEDEVFDLFGNTVAVPIIEAITQRIISSDISFFSNGSRIKEEVFTNSNLQE